MSKMSIDLVRHALNGPTMGTRWSALFFAASGFDPAPVQTALQAAVDEVEAQMSTWRPDSDLMRLNAAPVGVWIAVPSRADGGLAAGPRDRQARPAGPSTSAVGDAVTAWGFGPEDGQPRRHPRRNDRAAYAALRELELNAAAGRVRKRVAGHDRPERDRQGIWRGPAGGSTLGFGITSALVGIDGEMRALGARPDGTAWTVAVEAPDPERRAPHSILALEEAAVATSGDYRHWVEVQGRRMSHTMHPARGAPLAARLHRSQWSRKPVPRRTPGRRRSWFLGLTRAPNLHGIKGSMRFS